MESRVRRFNAELDLPKAVREALGKNPLVGYVEGPPTLNGVPHIGHIRGRIMKDLWYRFSTLSKKNVVFRAGWDSQGLPVELQAEKELGLSGNKWEDLKQIGEEKLVEACKRLIAKYLAAWEEADDLLGLLLDHSKAYMTYRDSYIEREWKFLESAWNDGILGEGFKVVPYCPSCQTSLSHAEAVLGYETLEDPSLYYKVRASDGTFLLIWTTMPFTVVTDEMVGVKPDADYAYVRVGEEVWVVGAERMAALAKELKLEFGETVKVVKGRDLEGLRYAHPLLSLIPGLERLSAGGEDPRRRRRGLRRHGDRDGPRPPRARERRGGLLRRDEEEASGLRAHRRQGLLHRGRREVLGDVRQGLGRPRGQAPRGERKPGQRRPARARVPDLLEVGPPAGLGREEGVLLLDRPDKGRPRRRGREGRVLLRPAPQPVHRVHQAVASLVHLAGEGLGDPSADLGLHLLQGEGPCLLEGEHRLAGGLAPGRQGLRAPPAVDRPDRAEVPEVRRRGPP